MQRTSADVISFWRHYLADRPEAVDLPGDLERPALRQPASQTAWIRVHPGLCTKLTRQMQAIDVSPEAFFTAAFALFLGKVANTRDFIVGVFGLPNRMRLDPREPFCDLARRTRQERGAFADYCDISLTEILQALDFEDDPARPPLFAAAFACIGGEKSEHPAHGGPLDLDVAVIRSLDPKSTAPFTDIRFTYNEKLFSKEMAWRLAKAFEQVLWEVADSSATPVGSIPLLSRDGWKQVLADFCTPYYNWPRHLLLHELFEARVDRDAAAPALTFKQQTWSYGQLEAAANRLAARLVERGVGPDSIVALVADRSPGMMIAILGVLKAGGAYLPIDPEAPLDRLSYILTDSGACLVVRTATVNTAVPEAWDVLTVEEELQGGTPAPRVGRRSEPEHLAYVIYTSGSTGRPKGVLIEHRSVVHFILAEREGFGITPADAILQFSAYTFDASVEQIWLALASGAKLVMPDQETILDTQLLTALIQREGITHLDTVPLLLASLEPEEVPSLKRIVVGGEACPTSTARRWMTRCSFYNEYGPTETTIASLRHRVAGLAEGEARVPIGHPIGMTRAYVLDWGGCLVPAGIRGELCIGGAGVARGYLRRPELTATTFVADPYSVEPGARMYRTGDMVRWLADGSLDFFGRVDHQIKIRGFRIELGELEAALLTHPDIVAAVATVFGESAEQRRLCGYYVPKRALAEQEVRAFLGKALPKYMVPDVIIQMEALPQTSSGKVDRRRLPTPAVDLGLVELPATKVEADVRLVWSELLGLDPEKIGVTRSFFELGGHSLLLMQLVAKLQKKFGVPVTAKALIAAPTIREIARGIAGGKPGGSVALPRAPEVETRAATSVQRRLYAIQQGFLQSTAYNLPLLHEIVGELDGAVLAKACTAIIERHESLRMGLFLHAGEIVQKIAPKPSFALEEYSLDSQSLAAAMSQFVRPFFLEEAPLFRAAVFKESGKNRYVAFDMHHIISDGLSIEVFMEELGCLLKGQTLDPVGMRYFDFAEWLASPEGAARLDEARAYWLALLGEELPLLDLPYDFARPASHNQAAADVEVHLDRQTFDAIAQLARNAEATPFAFFSAIYSVWLSCMSGSGDVVFGFPTAGRPHPEFERVIGMFVNTLAFRSKIDPALGFEAFLRQTMVELRSSLMNDAYPFEELVDALQVKPAPGRRPIFDTMLSYEGFVASDYDCGAAKLRACKLTQRVARMDLITVVRETPAGYTLVFEYSSELYSRATAERFAAGFTSLIKSVLANSRVRLGDLDAFAPGERERLIHAFNDTKHALPSVGAAHEMFEALAGSHPQAVAVVSEGREWSYGEVERRANALAGALIKKGIGAGKIVGILLDPCPDMLTSVLGVLKTGATFLPIDHDYPAARKAYMLEDSQAAALICKPRLLEGWDSAVMKGPVLDVGDESLYRGNPQRPTVRVKGSDAAYVIYTSGSTGKPKGVIIEHHSLLNFTAWAIGFLKITASDRWSKYAGFAFDASILEMMPAACSGACLVIVPSETRLSIEKLDELFATSGVTLSFLPTQLAEQFLRRATRHKLRIALVGGDKLRTFRPGPCTVLNVYGPTECTVLTTYYHVEALRDNIPIGRPLWNLEVLILDRLGRLCPIGVPGELCVAGDGVARGYLNRPDLTEERFVPHPFAPGRRMYRSGDLARWLGDGNIEFLGRIDKQVKIRGFRVELGEIEQALMALQEISEAVVVAAEGAGGPSDLVLLAYVVAKALPSQEKLKEELARFLPSYMVPARFVEIDKIPLTANGKVDKAKLPQVTLEQAVIAEPKTTEERRLRELYSRVLGIKAETISVDTSFLDLGGHSLKAAMLLSELYKQDKIELALADFLKASSVRQLATMLARRAASPETGFAWPTAPRQSNYPLSSSQSRIFAIYQLSPWSTVYNIPFAWEVTREIDINKLSRAFSELGRRHQSLRAYFAIIDGEPVQCFSDEAELKLEEIAVDEANLRVTLERFVQPFDLMRGPLVRAALVRAPSRRVLALDMHHIIADGLSVKILLEELQDIYLGHALPEAKPTFADFVCWEKSNAARDKRIAERAWWLERFADPPPPLELPYDFERPARVSFDGASARAELPEGASAALQALARAKGVTPVSVYLAAYAIAISRLANSPDVVIGMPASGRQMVGLDRVVGMFVNTVPLRMRLSSDEVFADLVARIGGETREAFERQTYQLGELVQDLALPRDQSRNPLFDVIFAWEDSDLSYQDQGCFGLKELEAEKLPSKFDLELYVQQTPKGPRLVMQYATKLFLAATAERFLGYIRSILEQAARTAEIRVRDFVMLAPWEQQMLLSDFNATKLSLPTDKTLVDLFAANVASKPDDIAVEDDHESLTFRELSRRAAALAGSLRDKGVKSGDLVALSMTRSVDLVVGIVGILQAGAGYLPIEPEMPADRARLMLADSEAELLVTNQGSFGLPPERVVTWNGLDWTRPPGVLPVVNPQSVAYVIYTSGSTGQPKGVVIEHRNAVNYLLATQKAMDMQRDDAVLLFSSFTFDASVEQIGLMLVAGTRLAVPSKDTILDFEAFEEFVIKHRVTQLFAVPLFMSSFHPKRPLPLRRIFVGGEVTPVPVGLSWAERATVYNVYGPTETTIIVLRYKVSASDAHQARLAIGRPIANAQIYIKDWTGNLAPLGAPGEIHIGGAGVARGYLNNEALTAEKFVPNPYGPGRLYRSGDLGRWRASGDIEFLGRLDHQIKIRGFRIELGEIEAALRKHAAVTEAVVIVVNDGDHKRLCAYLTTTKAVPAGELRLFLSRLLPSYMVPDACIMLDAFPVTVSGKIDRKKLPPPVFVDGGGEFDAPTSETEEKLVDVWAEVLKTPPSRLPLDRSFFEVGGHSLIIMQLITRIYGVFGVRLTPAEVFSSTTVRAQAALLMGREREVIAAIPRVPSRGFYPLSAVQKRMYAMQQASPDSVSYNMPAVFALKGRISAQRIEEILRALIQRHSSLRTAFVVHDGQPAQKVMDQVPFALGVVEHTGGTLDDLMAELMQPFDLAVAPLMRAWLVSGVNAETLLVIDIHHIAGDGHSTGILWRELAALAKGVPLPALSASYADYACWQQHQNYRDQLRKQRDFWLAQYGTLPAPVELSFDYKRPPVRTHEGALHVTRLTAGELQSLQALSRSEGSTLFATVMACFNLFLARITGSEDFVVGVPAAGRVHPDIQDLVGMFVNTLPMRARIPTGGSFRGYLAATRQAALDCLSNQEYELADLLTDLGGLSGLFDVMFVFQNKTDQSIDAGAFTLEMQDFQHRTAKMDLLVTATELEDGLELAFEYPTELFAASTIARLAGHFVHMIRMILKNPAISLGEIDLLSEADRKQLLVGFNDNARALPPFDVAHQAFEHWARATPAATAVIFRDLRLTYAEVNRRANIIADWLIACGVGRNDFVGLLLEPCDAHLPAILGILKSGAGFLPIDPEFPVGRKNLMLEDSGAKALLTTPALAEDIEFSGPRLDVLKSETFASGQAKREANPQVRVEPGDAAYLIYTSGSTGKPKGVVVEHRNLLNFVFCYVGQFAIDRRDVLSKYTGCSFDVSIAEIFPACLTGAALAVVPKEIRLSPLELDEYFERMQVTVAFLPTQFGEQYLKMTDNRRLRVLSLAGEKLHMYKPVPFVLANGYGPTECTVLTTIFEVTKAYDNIPIGKPLWNTQVLILDRQNRLCPIGVAGELCVAGRLVARGYLGRPDLTAERFVPHPFDPAQRIYRTGDRARWLPDGNIEYQGRFDTQVKIRGYRIELGEIEQALLKVDGVSEAVVIAAPDDAGGKFLVAYLVSTKPFEAAALKKSLLRDLPEYMIPPQMVRLAAIPLTPNGKVDRKALPAVKLDTGNIVPPSNPTEQRLVNVWAATLSIDPARIGVTTSFFELGGHSLRAIALAADIFREFKVNLKVSEIFQNPTIQMLAARLSARPETGGLEQIGRRGEAPSYPASSVQKRLFLEQSMNPRTTSYNVPDLFRVARGISRQQVAEALQKLVDRHEAFRSSFILSETGPRLRVATAVSLELPTHKTSEAECRGLATSLVQPFDLGTAPLARAAWLETETDLYLFFDMHHIVTDGTSIGLLLDDLVALIDGQQLPALKIDLGDYAVWENSPSVLARLKEQRQFWQGIFADGVPILDLVTDYPRPSTLTTEGDTVLMEIAADTCQGLRALALREGVSLYALLLAAFNVLLARLTRQEEIVVGTPVAGRWHPDMNRMVGMFVNNLVLRNQPYANRSFLEFAKEVGARVVASLDNQAFPFADLIELVGGGRRPGHNPVFDVLFVLQNGDERLERAERRLTPIRLDNKTAKFDLTVVVDEYAGKLDLALEYRSLLFKRPTIECYGRSLIALLADIVKRPDVPLGELSILSEGDRQLVQETWNRTERSFPSVRSAHGMFEEIVGKYGKKPALVFRDEVYTYEEMNARANRLAHRLIELGVGAEQIVGILTPPSAEMIIALMGVLKAGGAFLPLDHRYPADRVEYMLGDSGAKVLLAAPGTLAAMDWSGQRISLEPSLFSEGNAANPRVPESLRNLAYVIYTSGSTGRPKGVMIEHGSLTHFIHWEIFFVELGPADHVSKYAGFGFDASILEMMPALCSGAALHVVPDEIRLSLPELEAWVVKSGITFAFMPTAIGEEFIQRDAVGSLRLLTMGGDRLRRYRKRPYKIANEYGPTECTVAATACIVDGDYANIPIGKPLANTKIFILDAAGRLCPPGFPGELCIVGKGMGRGYLGNPDMTAQKYVSHPLAGTERMYRTGDLARWQDDGNIEFLGRIDSQVKIRGYRIERGEIEQAMLEIKGVQGAVVIDRLDATGEKYLCGYFVADADGKEQAIRDHLSKKLPDYMVPPALMRLASIPLTANGKVDRRQLPEPTIQIQDRVIVAPRSMEETMFLNAFGRVLGRKDLSIDDDFFALGGNSLKAVSVVATLAKDFRVTANDLFRLRTARRLAEEIPLARGDLQSRLEKLSHTLAQPSADDPLTKLQDELGVYRERCRSFESLPLEAKSEYRNILLTGATGFLGAYLLRDLLVQTTAKIFVPVRGTSREEAWDRLRARAAYYFGEGFLDGYRRRVFIQLADLGAPLMGLDERSFDGLAGSIDCIIHAAALTKHYGVYQDFVSANVDSTRTLRDLALRAKAAFNVVSTLSVGIGDIPGKSSALFTEFDCDIGQTIAHHYIKTKLEAEKIALEGRRQGLTCNIYRIGFLACDSTSGRFQENADDSGFVQKMRSFQGLGRIPVGALVHSFCPVNEVSEAILRLAMLPALGNETHHLERVLGEDEAARIARANTEVQAMADDEFYGWLSQHLEDPGVSQAATAILLHEGFLDDAVATHIVPVTEKTNRLLARIGFKWSETTAEQVWGMIQERQRQGSAGPAAAAPGHATSPTQKT